jgi:methionine-rich copper-binding protein CopC
MLRRVTAAAFVAGLALAPARAESALHNKLLKSAPAANSTVPAPTSLTLWFAERPELPLSTLVLKGADSTAVSLGPIEAAAGERNAMTAKVTGALKPGNYVMQYKTVGTDGHPIRGAVRFTVR